MCLSIYIPIYVCMYIYIHVWTDRPQGPAFYNVAIIHVTCNPQKRAVVVEGGFSGLLLP